MKIIDIHTHGLGGYDTRTINPDDILKIAKLHGAQGISDIIPAIYPGPIAVMRKHMTSVKEAIERQRLALSEQRSAATNSKFKTKNLKSARIAGIHLEGPFLNPSKAGALDETSFQKPSEKIWKSMIEGFEDIVKIVTISPELKGAQRLIKTISNMGIAVSLGHSDATYEETKKAFQAGARGITHLFNAMRGLHHREPGIAGFGLMNPGIYVEVIADSLHLNDQTIELIYKVKDPEKIIIVSDSVKETKTVLPNQPIQDNTGTLQGGSLTIIESATRLIGLGFDRDKVMACISANPCSYLLSSSQ
jgi:N-acetylglucosamine-6-phosphate deacetylase